MRKNTRRIMSEAVIEILERFTFMVSGVVTTKHAAEFPASRNFAVASMNIAAPARLSVRMGAPIELCRQFAANLLAMDAAKVSDDAAEDALKELLNESCGLFASSFYGDSIGVELTPPRVTGMSAREWDKFRADRQTQTLDVEGRPLAVRAIREKS